MQWLWPLGWAGLSSLAILVALWRFARPRQTFVIPSLVPFQHLTQHPVRSWWSRWNVLFWLQAAALALLTIALAEPALVQRHEVARPRRTLLIIDNAFRMRAVTKGERAFDRAKAKAGELVKRARAGELFAMVSTAPPQSLTPQWLDSPAELQRAIRGLAISDGSGDLQAAVDLALALYEWDRSTALVILTNAEVHVPEAPPLPVEVWSAGQPGPNASIAALEVWRRWWEPGSEGIAFVTVAHDGHKPQRVSLTVKQDGALVRRDRLHLEPLEAATVEVRGIREGATVTAQLQAPRDALPDDNERAASAAPSTRRLMVISPQPEELGLVLALLRAVPSFEVRVLSPDEAASASAGDDVDLMVFHRVPLRAVARQAIWVMPGQEISRGDSPHPVLWESAHPLVRYLTAPSALPVASAARGGVPPGFQPLVWANDGETATPLLAVRDEPGKRQVIIAGMWDPRLPALPLSWSIVWLNAINWLFASDGSQSLWWPQVFQPVWLALPAATPPTMEPAVHVSERVDRMIAPWLLMTLLLVAAEWMWYWRRQRELASS